MCNIILMTCYEYTITEEVYVRLLQTSSVIKRFPEPLNPFTYEKGVGVAKRGKEQGEGIIS